MIDVYSWPTPNGHKIHIMMEETGLPYRVHGVDIGRGDQFEPAFLKISPNNKIPAIVDSEGPDGKPISIFESAAILLYLAEKTGKFMPKDARGRYAVLEWLMFQMGNIGPMFGQANHFRAYAPEKIPYAIDRYTKEANRLYGVMDRRLAVTAEVSKVILVQNDRTCSHQFFALQVAIHVRRQLFLREHRGESLLDGIERFNGAAVVIFPMRLDELFRYALELRGIEWQRFR